MRFKKHVIAVNGLSARYWEKNSGQKAIVIFLHGFPGSHRGMVEMADRIGAYRLLIPDLPACGESEPMKGRHTMKNYAKWLNDFMDTLSIESAIIIGHSFGARVALIFAVCYPGRVAKLALITPVAKVDSMIGRVTSLDYELAEFLPSYMQKRWLFNGLYRKAKNVLIYKSSSPRRRRHLMEIENKETKEVDARANIEVFEEFYNHESLSKGDKIHTKTLIIACDKDAVATLHSVKELSDRFLNAEMKVMKNSGHLVVSERPRAVGRIICQWLKFS